MARKPKASAPKPKPLVPGQQTLFAAYKLPASAPAAAAVGDKRSREDAEQPAADAFLEQRLSDSGARPSGEAEAQPPALLGRRSSSQVKQQPQLADVLLVLDFEATASQDHSLAPQELIEFSGCLLNSSTLEIEAEFQQYVQPTENPLLNAFTTHLTGITQRMVDNGMSLSETMRRHDVWLQGHGVHPGGRSCLPVTWTEWDLKKQLETECKWRKLQVPSYLRRWHDLRKTNSAHHGSSGGLKGAVRAAGLEWEGRAHSGLDDARNTARLAAHLIQRGAVLDITGRFDDCREPGQPGQQGTLSASFPLRLKKARTVDGSGKWNGQCECGVKAKLCTSGRPGPFLGRKFYGCGTWTQLKGRGDCNLFKWQDET